MQRAARTSRRLFVFLSQNASPTPFGEVFASWYSAFCNKSASKQVRDDSYSRKARSGSRFPSPPIPPPFQVQRRVLPDLRRTALFDSSPSHSYPPTHTHPPPTPPITHTAHLTSAAALSVPSLLHSAPSLLSSISFFITTTTLLTITAAITADSAVAAVVPSHFAQKL